MGRSVSLSDLSIHDSPEDLWVAVHGKVYDLTRFTPGHPGGAEIIYKYGGRDATAVYADVHPPSLIAKELEVSEYIGELEDLTTTAAPPGSRSSGLPNYQIPASIVPVHTSTSTALEAYRKPPLSAILNLNDFEQVARNTLSKKSWAYLSGASNDNFTRDANSSYWRRIWFRPRLLRDVRQINTQAWILNASLSIPVFISPTGLVTTAGHLGELALAQAASSTGIIQCIATPAAYPYEEILEATPAGQPFFFQLYVNKEREKSEAVLRQVTASGKVKAIIVTVDLPVMSKREEDERIQQEAEQGQSFKESGASVQRDKKVVGISKSRSGFIDSSFNWNDLEWVRKHTHLPILVKGIQSAKDAREAMRLRVQGVVLSNHGGRALDTSSPAIITLLEMHRVCPEVFASGMEILIDGGVRRGSDVVKAICLGATGVGIGRPFVYSVGYGVEGVEHAINLLREEIETCMKLCGILDLMRDASPEFVNTAEIDYLVPNEHHPYARKYSRGASRL